MLPLGHLSASYLLTKFSKKLSLKEILLVTFCGIVLDFDILTGIILNVSHHDLFTHTPFGAIIVGLIIIFLFRKELSLSGKILILASLLLHLVLDESGYWLYYLGLQNIISWPQINWLYPFKPFSGRIISSSFYSIYSFILIYLNKARASITAEILFFITALLIYKWQRKVSKNQ